MQRPRHLGGCWMNGEGSEMTAPKWAEGLGRLPEVIYKTPRLCGKDWREREAAGRELRRLQESLSEMQVMQLRADLKKFAGWLLRVEVQMGFGQELFWHAGQEQAAGEASEQVGQG